MNIFDDGNNDANKYSNEKKTMDFSNKSKILKLQRFDPKITL